MFVSSCFQISHYWRELSCLGVVQVLSPIPPSLHVLLGWSHISSPQTTVNPICPLYVCYSISSAEGRSPWLNSWHAKYLALLSLPEAGHQLAPQLCILDFIINYREGTALCTSVKSKHRSRWLQLVTHCLACWLCCTRVVFNILPNAMQCKKVTAVDFEIFDAML